MSVQKQTTAPVYVGQANKDLTGAQLDEIERRAKARVTEVEQEQRKISAAQEKGLGSDGRVYGDIAMEATGVSALKALGTAVDFAGTRASDKRGLAGATHSEIEFKPRSIEDDIKSANRAPGIYRAPVEAEAYSASSFDTKMNLPEKVGLTGIFLQAERGTGNTKSWDEGSLASYKAGEKLVKDMPEMQMALKEELNLTVAVGIANQKELANVQQARLHHSQTMQHVRQIVPPGMGFDLSQGPRIRPSELLQEAKERETQWRGAQDSASGTFV